VLIFYPLITHSTSLNNRCDRTLKDIINSNIITTVRLNQIFRQSESSAIITNAHKVNKGILPDLNFRKDNSDFYFIEAETGDDIINKIITITCDRIPKKFNLNPINDIQLLCPMQRGGTGARSLNTELQKVLNPNYEQGITKFGQIFAVGDKIMQTENNYDKDTYNGDIGIISAINQEEQEITIDFYGNKVIYDYDDLDQITLAYAALLHKYKVAENLRNIGKILGS
jgi:exodeoxyribonuclease V alpha subunit